MMTILYKKKKIFQRSPHRIIPYKFEDKKIMINGISRTDKTDQRKDDPRNILQPSVKTFTETPINNREKGKKKLNQPAYRIKRKEEKLS